ncbi:MAG: tetratricopeptide repeat protein [Chthoniobacterales bacterium]|nr:tetratricopeptide repeat protein [Chthoniobacterales bacterium]
MKQTLILLLLAASLGTAAPGLTLDDAIRPLAEGVPGVAVERLQNLLAQKLSAAEQLIAKTKLTEALVRANRPGEALKVATDSGLTNNLPALFWKAQALAALYRWEEAGPLYAEVSARAQGPLRADAAFGEAQSFRALGQPKAALRVLKSLQQDSQWHVRATLGTAELLIDRGDLVEADHLLRSLKPEQTGERNERRYLFGRIQSAEGHYDRAVEVLFVILQKPEGVSHALLVATLCAIADAHLQGRTAEQGDDVLEDFVEHHPTDSALPAVFAKLDELYQAEQKPSPNELERWSRDRTEPRRVLAQWYLARSQLRAGDRDRAIKNLTRLRASRVQLPSLGQAQLELARLLLADRQWAAAIEAGEAARRLNPAPAFAQQAAWLTAGANYRAGRLEAAAPIFEQIAHDVPAFANQALFNAALCWLRLDRTDRFANDYRQISNDPAKQTGQADLLLEKGSVQAAQGKAAAAASLQNFIRDFPKNPRVSEAWVALAELAFHAPKPDMETARQDLARARQGSPTPAAIERADYLEIWLNDAAPAKDESQVILVATAFLQRHSGSPFTAEVRMKLAEAYFRRQDFANAQTQFELLAQQNPDADLTEKALFFAARSAMSSMGAESLDHALALLDQVVKLNGDLKWAARNEEAAIERRLGKNADALAIYEEVLKNEAKPPERREALCGKGDVFYEMGAAESQNYRRAIDLFQQLANEPGVPAHWRNQAEFKQGKALEKLNDKAAALTTYYTVLEEGAQPQRQHEFFWFYKAGFSAAHLLEEASDWKSAVAVYRKLAAVGGPRSDEAKTRLTQLRLEHFLWEE